MAEKKIKRATQDIHAAFGVLAFRKGDVVPEGNELATSENTATEGTKAAEAALSERGGEIEPVEVEQVDPKRVVNAKK